MAGIVQFLLSITLCKLYSLPGPPSFQFQKATFQLYPINRRLCPNIDPQRDAIFELYTRKNPEEPHILLTGNATTIQTSNLNYNNPTLIFFHGFLESSKSDDAIQMKTGYLHIGDYNVILVNNQRLLAGIDYITAALNCDPIARFSARFIDYLAGLGLQLSSLHIIGMSLGGQIAGLTGKHITTGKVARITGLEPAGVLFSWFSPRERITAGDAEFVDIVHTNANFFGTDLASGDIDIWVNGGTFQPGCSFFDVTKRKPGSVFELIFCNHYQSYRMYVNSLYNPRAYLITRCRDYSDYLKGECRNANTTYLGQHIDETLRGNFYIKTGITAVNI